MLTACAPRDPHDNDSPPSPRPIALTTGPAPTPAPPSVAERLAERGWVHLPRAGGHGLDALLDELQATILHRTDVVVRPGRGLVTSARALDFHTDHHHASLIAWLCLAQTSRGGETLLADGAAAFDSLCPEHQRALAEVRLFEHSVFPGDANDHPLVEHTPEGPRLYCSFWFDSPLDPTAQAAFGAFHQAVRDHQVARLRLAPGDVLLVDNRRVLHSRTAIAGSRDRHLVRLWLTPARPLPRG